MKKVLSAILVVMMIASLTGCNKQLVDMTYSYEKAIVYLPNGEVVDSGLRFPSYIYRFGRFGKDDSQGPKGRR